VPAPMPERFRNEDGTPADSMQWRRWLDQHADFLASFLWPRWKGGKWTGDVAAGNALTLADLRLMEGLAAQLERTIPGTAVSHRAMFVAEDDDPPQASGLLIYAPDVNERLLRSFMPLLKEGGMKLAAPASLELKHRIQRPRPYQTAFMLRPDKAFAYLVAHSATTPSMVSGHCLQGSLALVNVVVRFEYLIRRELDAKTLGSIQSFLIDGGDRRVFAGVHYPSDNVSSWFTALRLCRHFVFDDMTDPQGIRNQRTRAREVLWTAVREKSAVYQAMLNDASSTKSPYAAVLKRLQTEGDDTLP
jgi:hypothetical protein